MNIFSKNTPIYMIQTVIELPTNTLSNTSKIIPIEVFFEKIFRVDYKYLIFHKRKVWENPSKMIKLYFLEPL